MKRTLFFSLLFSVLLIVIFRPWFTVSVISGGDFWYYSQSSLTSYSLYPFAWSWSHGFGLGGNITSLLWLSTAFNLLIAPFKALAMPWEFIERFSFLYPFLIITIVSSVILGKTIFAEYKWYIVTPAIYLFNSYALMLVGGGQVMIALSYALAPLTICYFMKIIEAKEQPINKSLLLGILLSLQLLFDIRVTFMLVLTIGVYWLFFQTGKIKSAKKPWLELGASGVKIFLIPFSIMLLSHAFWSLPLTIVRQYAFPALDEAYISSEAVRFFSFATFEQSLSLLHPNWPENIFGKVGFMKPEFLLLPILAFSSLLFVKRENDQRLKSTVLFFCILALLGAFLAKGANEPFGDIYLWLFDHVPGFIMFRDPTKWYMLVAISYSVLIPFSLKSIYNWLKPRREFKISNVNFQINTKNKIVNLQNFFLLLVLSSLLLLIHPALFGQLTGTFKPTTIPKEYQKLERFLTTQDIYFRTLWIPVTQRFGYMSQNHPAISARDFFKLFDTEDVMQKMSKNSSLQLLQEAGVKYIIVPFDSEKEIFLKDREYDHRLYVDTVEQLSGITWLEPIEQFNEIVVFEVPDPKDHFWIEGKEDAVRYNALTPTKYTINVKEVEKGDKLIFSESFDPNWVIIEKGKAINSQKYNNYFNSFQLPRDGEYEVKIYYTPQKWVDRGLVISGVSFVTLVGLLIFTLKKRKNNGH